MNLDTRIPAQMEIWVAMTDLADAYDAASMDLFEGASGEILLALAEGGSSISAERRKGLIAVGALLLRLSHNAGNDRAASTVRMLVRLGISSDDSLSSGNR